MGATVVIVGRNPAKCAAVVSEIKHSSGNDGVEALCADLSIMAEVQQVTDQFKAKYQKLHVLVNNAGGAFGKRQVTAEAIRYLEQGHARGRDLGAFAEYIGIPEQDTVSSDNP
jgi:NAD(P)-dependent dehydrogenase (short-subunit alcohol dehydrogenase family)